MKHIISNIIGSPVVKNFAAAAAKNAQKAAKAIKAGIDSWHQDSVPCKEPSEKDRLGLAISNLMTEEAIKGTLTQRTARALVLADEYVAELRAVRVWGYVTTAKAVECLTSSNLRDIVQVIKHCEVELTAQSTKDKNQQLCKELLELAVQKDGMKLEEAIAFGQSAAEDLLLRRFRAESAATNND